MRVMLGIAVLLPSSCPERAIPLHSVVLGPWWWCLCLEAELLGCPGDP